MSDLILDLTKAYNDYHCTDYKDSIRAVLDMLESADDNTMEWIYEGDEISGVFKCSKCGMESEDMDFEHFHFCPNCGRKAVNK